MSEGEFAEKLGIAQPTLSNYEKKEQWDEGFLIMAAKELNIPVEAITHMEEGATVNIISNFSDSAALNYQPTFNPLEKIIELYENLLQTERNKVAALEAMLKDKK